MVVMVQPSCEKRGMTGPKSGVEAAKNRRRPRGPEAGSLKALARADRLRAHELPKNCHSRNLA